MAAECLGRAGPRTIGIKRITRITQCAAAAVNVLYINTSGRDVSGCKTIHSVCQFGITCKVGTRRSRVSAGGAGIAVALLPLPGGAWRKVCLSQAPIAPQRSCICALDMTSSAQDHVRRCQPKLQHEQYLSSSTVLQCPAMPARLLAYNAWLLGTAGVTLGSSQVSGHQGWQQCTISKDCCCT